MTLAASFPSKDELRFSVAIQQDRLFSLKGKNWPNNQHYHIMILPLLLVYLYKDNKSNDENREKFTRETHQKQALVPMLFIVV